MPLSYLILSFSCLLLVWYSKDHVYYLFGTIRILLITCLIPQVSCLLRLIIPRSYLLLLWYCLQYLLLLCYGFDTLSKNMALVWYSQTQRGVTLLILTGWRLLLVWHCKGYVCYLFDSQRRMGVTRLILTTPCLFDTLLLMHVTCLILSYSCLLLVWHSQPHAYYLFDTCRLIILTCYLWVTTFNCNRHYYISFNQYILW